MGHPDLIRQIQIQRPRIARTGSALDFLLKRPWGLSDLTRGPAPFKNIYAEVLFYSLKPLIFLNIEPAVQVSSFCELALRFSVYLHFSPRC